MTEVAKWNYRMLTPGEMVKNPIQGEFFASESIAGPAEALVREGIQNAMDAALPDAPTVRVRIFLSDDEHAVAVDRMTQYTGDLWDHVGAEGNGLKSPPSNAEPCRFLAFEDFGTTGLQGDTAQWKPEPGENPFFHFFRAEGSSDKCEGKGGSWGVGKYVFPRSSRANAVFAVTVRADDKKRLLMGAMALKHHSIGKSCFTPNAWFGIQTPSDASATRAGLVMPIDEPAFIDNLIRDFRLTRQSEPGLSVIVPWLDPEVTRHAILEAVVRGWFYPILRERLTVELVTPSKSTVLNAKTFAGHLAECETEIREHVTPLIRLTTALSGPPGPGQFTLKYPTGDGAVYWRAEMVTDDAKANVRKHLEKDEPVVFRVPLSIRLTNSDPRDSHFDIALMRDDKAGAHRVTFLRDGIIVPEVKHQRVRDLRALVVAEHGPIANLLRDAEHPAHTHWSKDTSNFKGKYENGLSYLTFVQNSVSKLMGFLHEQDSDEDPNLLIDFFSLPIPLDDDEDARSIRKRKKKRNPETPEPPIDPPPAKPKRYRVVKAADGFTVTRGDEGTPPPPGLRIRVAYDCRKGNALNNWDPADFQLDQAPIVVHQTNSGFDVIECKGQRMQIRIKEADFRLTVTGFDVNRDVIVDVRPMENSDD